MKRVVGILVVLAMAGGIGWQVYRKLYTAKGLVDKKAAAAVPVEVAQVRRASLREIIQPSGDLTAHSEFVVAPKVAGRLVQLVKDIGDAVSNGELIAVLDDEEYMQQVEQAKAELEVVKATVDEARNVLETAQREFDRVEALRAKKISSESELDEARSQFRTAQSRHKVSLAQVAQKEAALKTAEVRQSYTRIHASWTGGSDTCMIGERFANTGAMLAANDKIVSVVDIDQLTAVIHVTERDYAKVRVGQTVEVLCDAYPGRPFIGKVVRVAPLVKQTSREARVEIQVDNRERLLRPGMFILARIELDRHENVTVVPEAAIVRRGDGVRGVFLAEAKALKAEAKTLKARFVPVTEGISEGLLVEIVEPALSGSVITLGQNLLEDGTPVMIADENATAGAAPAASSQAAESKVPTAEIEARS